MEAQDTGGEPMTDLLQKAIAEMTKLPEQQQDMVATWILEKLAAADLKTGAEWEESVLEEALDGALKPDGSIDFDVLRARGEIMSLSDLNREDDQDTES
jgi:hypothetical protein